MPTPESASPTTEQQRLYPPTISGLIAIIAASVTDPRESEMLSRAIASGGMHMRLSIVINVNETEMTAEVADSAPNGKVVPLFTHRVLTTWPAELVGFGEPKPKH